MCCAHPDFPIPISIFAYTAKHFYVFPFKTNMVYINGLQLLGNGKLATIPFQIRAQELLVYANGSVDVFW